MNFLEKNLAIIEFCIKNNIFEDIETNRLELKDLSTKGDWTELHKTVCAFLNTDGGIVIIGIRENNNQKDKTKKNYKLTGFDYNNENKLKQLEQQFSHRTHQKRSDLGGYFRYEIKDFLTKKIAIIYVDEVPDDEKYIFYQKNAYKRKLTGDHVLTLEEIEVYEELKQELISQKELSIVRGASLDLINIDKLNEYIILLNRQRKIQTLKADLATAMPFLEIKSFVRNHEPTLLGMLFFGDHVEDYLQGKCDVNCSISSPSPARGVLVDAKQRYQDNIIALMEQSFNFVWRNIRVGVLYANSGTPAPEYPEDLIRESINNALAHRNYSSNRPVFLIIKPQNSLSIQNPGAFSKRQIIHLDTELGKIRRILNINIARNPKLTNLLYSFDRFEGQGNGLASLVNACLNNEIDVPFYTLKSGEVKLTIPKGKVLDEKMKQRFNSFKGYILKKYGRELKEDEEIILSFFYKSERLNRVENYTILLTTDNNHKEVIADLEEKGLIFKNSQSLPIFPIYQIDRTLTKTDFSEELQGIFGNYWENLKENYREVLNAIYLHNFFGEKKVSANSMANYLFVIEYGNISNVEEYERYRSRLRPIFKKLEDRNFILRKDGKTRQEKGKPDFIINKNFKKKSELF